MTRPQQNADELTVRVFRALYPAYDLRILASGYVAVPKGTPWYSGSTLGEIARQIFDRVLRVTGDGQRDTGPGLPAASRPATPNSTTSTPAPRPS